MPYNHCHLLKRTLPLLCLALALAVGGCAPEAGKPPLDQVLRDSWRSYKNLFISTDGRVVIPERQGETISEAQAYALLRAGWADDAPAFADIYAWTKRHLSREKSHRDHLLAWRWGPGTNGAGRVLDANSASDADLDYAMALILAARRGWTAPPGLPDYGAEAKAVLADIWDKEVLEAPAASPGGDKASMLLLTPGNWRSAGPPYLLNPSYFSPGAYRVFARFAPDQPWLRLHGDTYRLLNRLAQGWGGGPNVGLFPDWCQMTAAGQFQPAPDYGTDFGWEAVRLPWRLALDALWFNDPQAKELLGRTLVPFLKRAWQQGGGRLAAVYHLDGAPAAAYDSPVMYAGALAAALGAGDQDFARLLADKILAFYHQKDGQAYFVAPDHYYANNLAWLGLALYAGRHKAAP